SAESGPGSSGAWTSGITGSAGSAFVAGLTAALADLRGAGTAASTAGAGCACGGVISITGRVTPISASGTFQAKPSSRPPGDTGIQRSDTVPSAVHSGSPEA